MNFNTADLSDAHPELQVADPLFLDYGQLTQFCGPLVTVKVFEDNAVVRSLLEEDGEGRVLVIDGGASLRCALVGGNLGILAVENGWRGLVVNGCIRDSLEISRLAVGIKALQTNPRKSAKGLHTGHRDLPVTFAGVTFRSGEWIYADADGILVSALELAQNAHASV